MAAVNKQVMLTGYAANFVNIKSINHPVYIGSIGPWAILDIYTKSKLGPQFGRPPMIQLGRQCDAQHLHFGLSNFFDHHVDIDDRCRKFKWI